MQFFATIKILKWLFHIIVVLQGLVADVAWCLGSLIQCGSANFAQMKIKIHAFDLFCNRAQKSFRIFANFADSCFVLTVRLPGIHTIDNSMFMRRLGWMISQFLLAFILKPNYLFDGPFPGPDSL